MSGYWADFLKIAVAHLLAAASPGPDFAIVLKQSLRGGRRLGVATAWGVATAICLHVAYTLLGLGLVLRSSPTVFTAVKVAGAGYLGWMGIKALRTDNRVPAGWSTSKNEGAHPGVGGAVPERFAWPAWRTGFFTNALNPKVTLFFVAVFAALVRPGTPLPVRLLYGVWIPLSTGLWFTFVAFVFTRESIRRQFLRYGFWIDRVLGAVFLVFAVLLIATTLSPG